MHPSQALILLSLTLGFGYATVTIIIPTGSCPVSPIGVIPSLTSDKSPLTAVATNFATMTSTTIPQGESSESSAESVGYTFRSSSTETSFPNSATETTRTAPPDSTSEPFESQPSSEESGLPESTSTIESLPISISGTLSTSATSSSLPSEYPCPDLNGTTYVDNNGSGRTYQIYCDTAFQFRDEPGSPLLDSFDECMQSCDNYVLTDPPSPGSEPCIGVTFIPGYPNFNCFREYEGYSIVPLKGAYAAALID